MRRILYRFLVAAVILVFLWLSSVAIDYYRFTQRASPVFARAGYFYFDGGTRVYNGLGYRITFYRRLGPGPEMQLIRTDKVFEFGSNSIFSFEVIRD